MHDTEKLKGNLSGFLGRFPTDADCWSQATDEIRDLARIVREYYNGSVLNVPGDCGIDPINFHAIKTPEKEMMFIDELIKS